MALLNFVFGETLPTTAPISQATGTAAPIAANVPVKWFGIAFLVILAIFIGWYLWMRRR